MDERLTRPTTVGELVQVQARCPGFTLDGLLARTGKSLLVTGTYQDAPAVAKLLTNTAPLWRGKFAAELHAYQVFAEHPPPVPVPRLLASDAGAGLLVLERISGRPAAAERHPSRPLPPGDLDAVLGAAGAVAGWVPPAGAFGPVFDYPDRFARYGPAGHGLLTAADVGRLTAVYNTLRDAPHDEAAAKAEVLAGGPRGLRGWAFAHGDALLGNFLLIGAGCVLVDWEFAGLYLPGYDHALLWTVLHADPLARARLRSRARVGGHRTEAAFWVNAAMTLTREIRTHRELTRLAA